jgi:predicted ATPase
MELLTAHEKPTYDTTKITETLTKARGQAETSARLGLGIGEVDYEQLFSFLQTVGGGPGDGYALTVLGAYTEFLESQAEQRRLVADRLLTFERILGDFLLEKRVSVDPRRGFVITTRADESLREDQLSSGEYHLLYLMVTALVSRRRSTVIAIDEPEMSMHIAWQRKLIRELVACASNASPQFIFATHSPEIIADYRDALIPMNGVGE